MLLTYFNTTPYSKFILIDDNIEERALNILTFLIQSRLKLPNCEVHYGIFEGCYSRKLVEDAITHDFTRCMLRLNSEDQPTLENLISKINSPSVLFIDSLVHVIFSYGFRGAYRLFHKIMNNNNILQVVTVYHMGIIDDFKFLKYFRHLATFLISLESKFDSNRPRLAYVYKKSGGKLVKQMEEYYFEEEMLKTEVVKKFDPQKLIQEPIEVQPDELTTFKISLEDNEKKARESVTLPYLPKEESSGDSKIIYQFDDIDDWDEEDPDDDLNI